MQNKPRTHIPQEAFVRRHRPIFVTLFVLIPVLTMPVLLIFTMLKSDSMQHWCTLHVFYENSMGLKKGNQVSMSGIAIGHVKQVDLIKEKEIHVSVDINNRYRHLIRKDTRARLQQRGFVGDWEIALIGGTLDFEEAADNDTLKSEKMPTIDDMIELGAGIIDTGIALLSNIAAIVKGIEDGEGTVGQILKNDSLFMHINQIGANAVRLTEGVGRILVDTRGTIRNVDSLLITLNDAGKGGTALVDTITALVNTVNQTITETMTEVETILKDVKTVSGETPELMNRLQHDLGQVELLLRTFQDEGLLKTIGGGNAPKNPHLADTP